MNERIKQIRTSEGLSQQKFADRLGIARGNIAAYEVGKNAPSDAVIVLICKEFNVNEKWLRHGTGEMFNNPDDLVAECVWDLLLTHDDAFYNMIKGILMTYRTLDDKSKEVIQKFILDAVENSKKE